MVEGTVLRPGVSGSQGHAFRAVALSDLGRHLSTVQDETLSSASPQVPEPKEEGSAPLAVPGVYFTCPLTGATLRKDQRDSRIREAILSVSAGLVPPPLTWRLQGRSCLQQAPLRPGGTGPSPSAPAYIVSVVTCSERECSRVAQNSEHRRAGRQKPPSTHLLATLPGDSLCGWCRSLFRDVSSMYKPLTYLCPPFTCFHFS